MASRLAPSWTECLADVVAVTRDLELEGAVYKRLDAPYRPGRRSAAWRKVKHRRRETLVVTAWSPGDREPDTFYVARLDAAGEPVPAGGVQLGLATEKRAALRAVLGERETERRRPRRVRPVAPGVHLVVDAHGRSDGILRDAVMRDVLISE